jgi:hypothetical protein
LWGPEASSDKLRAGARCTCCGGKGATVQRPGWAGNNIGFYPFPTTIADEISSPSVGRGPNSRMANRTGLSASLTMCGLFG